MWLWAALTAYPRHPQVPRSAVLRAERGAEGSGR